MSSACGVSTTAVVPMWMASPSTRTSPKAAPSAGSGSCDIKGNIASDGEKIYHLPGQQYYGVTKISTSKGERWFCSEADAVAAGWRKSQR